MKKFIIFLVILGISALAFDKQKKDREKELARKPAYLDARLKMSFQDRSLDSVMFVKALDEADCQQQSRVLEDALKKGAESICPTCKFQQAECKEELAPRYAKLFDDVPTSVTYLSLSRGSSDEREARVIYWGVSVEESDKLCNAVPQFQKGRKGKVSCVRAQRE